jgi:D-beta-D-heptose 7-phosphate kinase / D-beta-D-heptose 1-phosphate adenosyltransferase
MLRADELALWVPRLKEACVGCVGDVMLDQFVYGKVERISPEGPIPILRMERQVMTLGGMGNVVRNLASLGSQFHVVTVIGDDVEGNHIRHLLQELNANEAHLLTVKGCSTTVKTRYIAGSQQIVRVDRETDACLDSEISQRIIDHIQSQVTTKVLVLSDYGKGVLTSSVCKQLIDHALQNKQVIVVDPKGNDYERYIGASVVTPNRQELKQASGMPVKTDKEVIAASRYLISTFKFGAVVATLSEHGMIVVSSDGNAIHIPAEAKEVYDVSGAGDTVVATLASALTVGLPLLQASCLANAAAGIVVGKIGTAAVGSNELYHSLRSSSVLAIEQKQIPIDEIEERLQQWRNEDLRIGFTNGCFDLLHPGHVMLLSKAAEKVDKLVVGLNSDQSIRRLKGSERPIQSEAARSTVLASLTSVSLVVIFEENTPQKLIEIVRPDVLVKGADYTVETVVGAEFVQGYGGKVLLIDLLPEQSTTRLVRRINDSSTV